MLPPHRYIAIERPIWIDKTLLAALIAELWARFRSLIDRAQDNPFLERFYCESAQLTVYAQRSRSQPPIKSNSRVTA
ncbi:MAG: hypothetical protein E5299_00909 [Burkholderia gladioli]|nr:MAG: hypothetical protein E5299_00909 [Burkholderia gladioli]